MPYPSCFGNFKSGERPDDPAGVCRKCQPFRKCREETLKRYREEHGIKANEPICMGQYAADTRACRDCKHSWHCQQLHRKHEKAVELERKQTEEEREQAEESVLVARLKKKVQDQWGGSDAGSD